MSVWQASQEKKKKTKKQEDRQAEKLKAFWIKKRDM